jgi:Complex I intermediate-associated protein 30 (CIA30)
MISDFTAFFSQRGEIVMMMFPMLMIGRCLLVLCLFMLSAGSGAATAAAATAAAAASRHNQDVDLASTSTATLRRRGATTSYNDDDDKHEDDDDVEVNSSSSSSVIILESFDNPQYEWIEMSDPVMGGASSGTFTMDPYSDIAVLRGHVAIVPFLNAPGFILAETTTLSKQKFPDVSSCQALQLTLRSLTTPTYAGFRVSFGTRHIPNFRYGHGYKASFHVPPASSSSSSSSSSSFVTVTIPFTDFTIDWDAGTGDAITSCADNTDNCPDEQTLQNMQRLALWAEGVEGNVDLQVQSIAATQCGSSSSGGSGHGSSRSAFVQVTTQQKQEPTTQALIVIREEEDDAGRVGSADDEELHEIIIEDFAAPKISWAAMNDPVMGGKSHATVTIDKEMGVAIFDGNVVDVPFLQSPGFVTMRGSSSTDFPDVSSCVALQLVLRTNNDDNGNGDGDAADDAYQGYKLSFGNAHVPGGRFAYGYKTPFMVPSSSNYLHDYAIDSSVNIILPFSDFSDNWDDATGDIKVSCADDERYCPDVGTLQNFKTLSLWGEGVAGHVNLEIVRISAVGCGSSSSSSSSSGRDGSSLMTTMTDVASTAAAAATIAETTTAADWTSSMVNANGGESYTNSGVSPAVASSPDNNRNYHFMLGPMVIMAAVVAASLLWNSHKRQQRRQEYEELISSVRHELFYY